MRPSISVSRPWLRRTPAFLFVLLLVAVGCGGAASAPLAGVGSNADVTGDGPVAPPAGSTTDETPSRLVFDAARPDLLVIKTGTLDLQVKDVPAAIAAAAAKITALGGYESGSEQSGEGTDVSATITYRIPAVAWDDALAGLRSLAIKIVAEKTQTQDVTGQVVDLSARIKNLQATEAALRGIMTQATKISDVLDVQAELTKVRGDIEQATAERNHLQEQAAFSSLSVRFGLKPEAAVVTTQKSYEPQSEVDRATASLVQVLQALATAGIWFGIVWLPILLAVGLIALLVLFVLRRLRRPGPTGEVIPASPTDG